MKSYIYFFLVIPLFTFGQTDLDEIVKTKIIHNHIKPVHSILLYLENVETGIIYNKGFGVRDKGLQKASKNDQFRIASSTKLFVSTIILQLAEEGKLNLNDKASNYLKHIDYLDFDNFHIYKGKSLSNEITVKQLLSHRSGLADIFSDKEQDFINLLLDNPQKQYSPKSIVELYYRFYLNKKPLFEPNNGWHYSDMNYVLIGLIIEQIEHIALSESIRQRILEPLKMTETYFEFYEPYQTEGHLVSQYVGDINFTEINTSFDWSGGGLVSTNKDMATFIKSLFNLKLINRQSLDSMIDVKYTKEEENRYGLGIYESIYNGNTYFGHYGFYGTYIGFCPKTKVVMSYSISQATPNFNTFKFINQALKLFE